MESNETKVMKDAAFRLQAFLAAKNINVGHATALEGLAACLGARNWRTAREKLNAPTASTVPYDVVDWPWAVTCRVAGSNEAHSGNAKGASPFEAQMQAIYSGLKQGDTALVATTVVDRETGKVVPVSAVSSVDLMTPSALFAAVVEYARGLLGPVGDCKVSDVDGWHDTNALLNTFEDIVANAKVCKQLDTFMSEGMPKLVGDSDSAVGFEGANGTFFTATMFDAQSMLLELMQEHENQITDPSVFRVLYQFRPLVANFAEDIGRIMTTWLVVG